MSKSPAASGLPRARFTWPAAAAPSTTSSSTIRSSGRWTRYHSTLNRESQEACNVIEALKSDEIVNKVGGRFKLTALIQRRMLELMDGDRKSVDRGNMTELEVVIQEILQDKIAIDYEQSGLAQPE